MASLGGEYEVVMVARSDGVIAARRAAAGAGLRAGDRRAARQARAGIVGRGGRTDYAYFTEERLREYATRAVSQALVNLESRPAPAGTMTVVLGPGWPGVLLTRRSATVWRAISIARAAPHFPVASASVWPQPA